MINSILNVLLWLFILIVSVGSGIVIYKLFRFKPSSRAEIIIISFGFGLLLLIYPTAAFGFLGLLKPAMAYLLLGILSIISIRGGRLLKEQLEERFGKKILNRLLLSALCIISVFYLLSTMAPPLDGDTLHSYLDVPRKYVYAGAIIPLPYEFLSHQPLNMQMLSSFALLLRGDELAQMLVGFTMALGAASVLYLIGRTYFSTEAGLWAALFFLSMYVVEFLVPTTKSNVGRAAFDLLSIYLISRWGFDKERQDRWLFAAGLFSGASFGSLYPGGFTAVVIILFIVLVSLIQRKDLTENSMSILRRIALFSVPFLLLSVPWLIKNLIETGNPVYPVLDKFITGREFKPTNYSKSSLSIITSLWDMSVGFAIWPYSHPIGPVFLALLPCAVLIRPVPKQVWWGLITFSVLYLMQYFMGIFKSRNLLTEIGLLAVIAAWGLDACKDRFRLIRSIFVACFTLYLLFEMFFFVRLHFFTYSKFDFIAGLTSREQFLEKNLNMFDAYPHWNMTKYINDLPKNEVTVVSLSVGNDYYISPDVRFIDSRMVDGNFYNPSPLDDQKILNAWKKLGVKYIFINDRYLKPISESEYLFIRSQSSLNRCLKLIKESDQQYLYRFDCS
ncbi:MAG: glycosyltransferase family 39 protein [Nitrospirota bacterium]